MAKILGYTYTAYRCQYFAFTKSQLTSTGWYNMQFIALIIWSVFVFPSPALATVLAEDIDLVLNDLPSSIHDQDLLMQSQILGTYNTACDSIYCCTITSTDNCSMAAMVPDETTLVQPGGLTRCIFSYSTPYAFQVIRGRSDRLLIYFQGGGACWDKGVSHCHNTRHACRTTITTLTSRFCLCISQSTTTITLCSTDSTPYDQVGIFNRTDLRNPYREHTVVIVLYCSGDAFAGDVVQPYNDKVGPQGKPVVQCGM